MDYTAKMVRAYAQCALWASVDEYGEPLNAVYGVDDVAEATMELFRADCEDFVGSNDLKGWAPEQAGQDFWLTRNRHGTGFWDCDMGRRAQGEKLAAAARVYGGCDLYVGDDGYIHASALMG